MINWRFILQPGTADQMQIPEPTGWNDTELVLQRDQTYHGISCAFSNKAVELQGAGAEYVKNKYEEEGGDAQVVLRIILECDDGSEDYVEDFSLDFNTYEELCGNECRVGIGFSEQGCFVGFRNNFDKKVDLDNSLAFDGTTPLTDYAGLSRELSLPAIPLRAQDRAENDQVISETISDHPEFICDGCTDDSFFCYLLPALPKTVYSALGLFNPSETAELIRYFGANNIPPYQVDMTVNTAELLQDLNVNCELSNAVASFRLKGSVDMQVTGAGNPGILLRAKIFRLPVGGDITDPGDWVEEYSQDLVDTQPGGDGNHPFDLADSVPITLSQGDLIHFGLFMIVNRISQIDSFVFNQDDTNNFFDLSADVTCPDTTADVYLIYETMSRIAEAISNKCLALESEYYGRMDSQPDSYDDDGCGALRAVTSGLYIRKAANPTFFMSMKDLIDGLRGIDNIGFALTRNADDDEILKVEPVRYFYNNSQVLYLPFIPSVKLKVAVNEIIGLLKFGFEKWQPEAINGLDEFNSTREYRIDLKSARQTLDFISKFIAGSYLWEQTRQQSFAETGAADTAYDDSTFIVCLMRDVYAYTTLYVERGIITSPANITFPDEVYNFRISPLRNLLRWFKSVAGSYRDHQAKQIIFSAGTGNIIAEGFIDDDCAMEAAVLAENQNVDTGEFKDDAEALPMLRPEIITFEYPMSLAEFKTVRANPYGFISYQCGTGDFLKAYIISLKYRPSNGMATFDLRKKYE